MEQERWMSAHIWLQELCREPSNRSCLICITNGTDGQILDRAKVTLSDNFNRIRLYQALNMNLALREKRSG